MPNDDATPVIIFIASVYAFGIVLLYALARAWEQSLSTRPRRDQAAESGKMVSGGEGSAMTHPSRTMNSRLRREDIRS